MIWTHIPFLAFMSIYKPHERRLLQGVLHQFQQVLRSDSDFRKSDL